MSDRARDLDVGWFEALAADEQSPVTGTYRSLTGKDPQSLEACFSASPERLGALRRKPASQPGRLGSAD